MIFFRKKAQKAFDREWLFALYKSLQERQRPEDIAEYILSNRSDLRGKVKKALEKAAKHSFRGALAQSHSSMLTVFKQPYGMRKQLTKAEQIFRKVFLATHETDFYDPSKVEAFIFELSAAIGKEVGKNDFKQNRINAKTRRERLGISRRQYNKLFRHLTRLESKLRTLIREQKKLRFTKIGKSSLASEIEWSDFRLNDAAACFVAYYTARSNRRSVFTAWGQEKAFDEIAEILYQAATTEGSGTNWWVIAHVYPSQKVIEHLTEAQKGALLGKWTGILEEVAKLLEEIWQKSDIRREIMIVKKGNDSSTWNQCASAWNKARDNWMSIIYSLGLEGILRTICFGKVMRLMAADVACWHRQIGGDLDANTKVWNELPLPWEVFSKIAVCNIDKVREVCKKHGINPEKSGWVAPRPRTYIEKYKPTPELVHGVIVESPFLATIMRDAGFFSGKIAKTKDIGDPIAMAGLHHEVLVQHHNNLKPKND